MVALDRVSISIEANLHVYVDGPVVQAAAAALAGEQGPVDMPAAAAARAPPPRALDGGTLSYGGIGSE